MRWVRRWEVTIRYDDRRNSPHGTTKWQTIVDTPAELRRLVESARADPHVTAFPYRSIRELVGEEPRRCRNGHTYDGGSATRVRLDWAVCCCCGGHQLFCCARQGCGDVRVEPVPDVGCDAQVPGG